MSFIFITNFSGILLGMDVSLTIRWLAGSLCFPALKTVIEQLSFSPLDFPSVQRFIMT